MTDNAYDTIRSAVAEAEDEHKRQMSDMATAARLAGWHEQWYLDQLNAAYGYMLELDLFADNAAAEDEIVPRAEAIAQKRQAALTRKAP